MSWFSEFVHQIAPQHGWGSAFVTAGLGAFAGGLVASRAFTKRTVVAELNALSSAQTLCFSICNRFLALKGQHVAAMNDRFERVQNEHREFLKDPAQSGGQFTFQADFRTLTPVPVGNSILLATDIESGDAPALCERFVA
jgi:hypothetical protein